MIATVTLASAAGCAAPQWNVFRGQSPHHPDAATPGLTRTIYVVGHGWHTGIILDTAEIDRNDWPEIVDFQHRRYVEIGWGDEGFYRAKSVSLGLAARAVFTPTPSVLHVVGFDVHPQRVFVGSDLIELRVSEDGYRKMCRAIHKAFALDAARQPQSLGRGLYGDSRFYRANGSYYFPNTCNMWTAETLQQAGLPMTLAWCTTASGVLGEVKSQGRVLNSSSPMALIHSLGWGRPASGK
jgi:uncharacterized protein (TIGR02117 family)